MKTFGMVLIVLAGIGALLSSIMFGDVGISAFIGSLAALLAGLGLLKGQKEIDALKKQA